MITCARLRLKQMWQLMKAKTEMKHEQRTKNTEQRDEIGVAVQSWL